MDRSIFRTAALALCGLSLAACAPDSAFGPEEPAPVVTQTPVPTTTAQRMLPPQPMEAVRVGPLTASSAAQGTMGRPMPPARTPAAAPLAAAPLRPLAPGETPTLAPVMAPTQLVDTGPRRDFVVYFPYNSADLYTASLQTLEEVADTIDQGEFQRVIIRGHADAPGGGRYNRSLSIKRAQVVENVLSGKGVAIPIVQMSGEGETELRVPTRRKERINRRVEILLR